MTSTYRNLSNSLNANILTTSVTVIRCFYRLFLLFPQFCQPLGWNLSYEKQEPKFFVSVLTDIDANKHYCACLSFHETLAITQTRSVDDEDETIGSSRLLGSEPSTEAVAPAPITHHSVMYAPKCLVLISRLDCAETFKVRVIFLHEKFVAMR